MYENYHPMMTLHSFKRGAVRNIADLHFSSSDTHHSRIIRGKNIKIGSSDTEHVSPRSPWPTVHSLKTNQVSGEHGHHIETSNNGSGPVHVLARAWYH